ncbi:hypothetical protein, variant [Exophiala mesophila]|uniref:DUF427 domain-containing protein n=1 Tax=Exophiala mesophila TaxID=212818 RepID=A0A0D1ZSF4_EXOME|nr:hypothetical protein, variant [Exophiala mesophila]KIV96849.1 hypothetical protein, variant [Exophiala mesophila]
MFCGLPSVLRSSLLQSRRRILIPIFGLSSIRPCQLQLNHQFLSSSPLSTLRYSSSRAKANMSDLADLASKLFHADSDFHPKILPTEKRVRGVLNGEWIFDTAEALMVWEVKWFPSYWIPRKDILPTAKLVDDKPISGIQSSTSKLYVGDKWVTTLLVPDSFNSPLAGYVKIEAKALDAWYEEQSEVLYHPKDPFHRVDILPSGRHVRVEVEGTVLADTTDQGGVRALFETNFPARWYLPRTAINWSYLRPSDTKTGCPYKGQASYYDGVIGDKVIKDIAWWYPSPIMESYEVTGFLCFYPDKVTTLVDGKDITKIDSSKSQKL